MAFSGALLDLKKKLPPNTREVKQTSSKSLEQRNHGRKTSGERVREKRHSGKKRDRRRIRGD